MIVAVAGASGFIGRAIVRRLAAIPDAQVRGMSRSPQRAKERLDLPNLEWVRGEVIEPATLPEALAGVDAIVSAVQFEAIRSRSRKRIRRSALHLYKRRGGERECIASGVSRQGPRRARDSRVGSGLHDFSPVAGLRPRGQSGQRIRAAA